MSPRDVETLTLFKDEELENVLPFQGFVTEIQTQFKEKAGAHKVNSIPLEIANIRSAYAAWLFKVR